MNTHTDNQQAGSRQAGSQQAGSQQVFDDKLRRLHAEAALQVSARTQAQLQQRRRAALSAPATSPMAARRYAWPVAASFAAILALAFGVQLRQDALPTSSAPILAVAGDDEVETTLAALDENPDFYLWLASNDAVALASE